VNSFGAFSFQPEMLHDGNKFGILSNFCDTFKVHLLGVWGRLYHQHWRSQKGVPAWQGAKSLNLGDIAPCSIRPSGYANAGGTDYRLLIMTL